MTRLFAVRQRSVAALLAMACTLASNTPSSVYAHDNGVATEAHDQEALRAFEAGVVASRAERWDEARLAFRRSAELAAKASTQFNLAVVCVHLGLGVEALAALDAFEQLAQGDGFAGMRAKVPQLRREASALVPETTVNSVLGPASEPVAPRQVPGSLPPRTPTDVGPTSRTQPPEVATATKRTLFAGGLLGGAALGFGVWAITRGHAYRSCLEDGPGDLHCYQESTIAHQRNAARASAIGLGIASALVFTVAVVRRGRTHSVLLSVTSAPHAFSVRVGGAL